MKQLLMAAVVVAAMPTTFILPTAAAAQVNMCEYGMPCVQNFETRGECQQYASQIRRDARGDARETILVNCEEQADGTYLLIYLT